MIAPLAGLAVRHPTAQTKRQHGSRLGAAPTAEDPMAEYGERQAQFADQMSDVEALMWNVEKDPWLSSTMATVVITDQPVDPVRLHRRLASGAASIARLRARVENADAAEFGRRLREHDAG